MVTKTGAKFKSMQTFMTSDEPWMTSMEMSSKHTHQVSKVRFEVNTMTLDDPLMTSGDTGDTFKMCL